MNCTTAHGFLWLVFLFSYSDQTQTAITCSKLTIGTLEPGVKPPRNSIWDIFNTLSNCTSAIELVSEWSEQLTDYGFHQFNTLVGETLFVWFNSKVFLKISNYCDKYRNFYHFASAFIPKSIDLNTFVLYTTIPVYLY